MPRKTLTPTISLDTLIDAMFEGVTIEDIKAIAKSNSSFRGFSQGYIAEVALRRQLLCVEGVTSVEKIPDQSLEKGDLKIGYNGIFLTLELKSLQTSSVRKDVIFDTWEGTVTVKNTDRRTLTLEDGTEFTTTSLVKGAFDILGICCLAVDGSWDFQFMESRFIPEHDKIPGLAKTSFSVHPSHTPCLTSDPKKVLESAYRQKTGQLSGLNYVKIEESNTYYLSPHE